jgi:hypothetical protein
MKDIAITITAQERMEIEEILVDKDEQAALTLVKMLADRIEIADRKQLRPPLDK